MNQIFNQEKVIQMRILFQVVYQKQTEPSFFSNKPAGTNEWFTVKYLSISSGISKSTDIGNNRSFFR